MVEFFTIKIQASFDALAALGHEPELVFAPKYVSLDSWKNMYAKLAEIIPDSHATKLETDGRGLDMAMIIASRWNELVPYLTSPNYNLHIICANSLPFLDSAGYDINGDYCDELRGVYQAAQGFTHPTLQSYLMAQAVRLHNDIEPLDSSSTGISWLDGGFKYGDNNYQMQGFWNPTFNRVELMASGQSGRTADIHPAVTLELES